jgi:hypothetical protein
MSVINGQRPGATGMEMATQAIRNAQDKSAGTAAQVARQSVTQSQPSPAKTASKTKIPAQTPPNPGPPGGAVPADLAQAMMDENLSSHELAANVKTVQAFDAMLEELTRLQKHG